MRGSGEMYKQRGKIAILSFLHVLNLQLSYRATDSRKLKVLSGRIAFCAIHPRCWAGLQWFGNMSVQELWSRYSMVLLLYSSKGTETYQLGKKLVVNLKWVGGKKSSVSVCRSEVDMKTVSSELVKCRALALGAFRLRVICEAVFIA